MNGPGPGPGPFWLAKGKRLMSKTAAQLSFQVFLSLFSNYPFYRMEIME
jgi:hypothetical protein